jgi:hypothetical protein
VQQKLDLSEAKRKIACLKSAKEKSVDNAKKRAAAQRKKVRTPDLVLKGQTG